MTATRMAAEFRAWATIDLQALRANLAQARACSPASSVVAVIKANGYGHGIVAVANALRTALHERDCFGVASLDEALTLRRAGINNSILLLEGFVTEPELALTVEHDFQCVVHSLYQLDSLQNFLAANEPEQPLIIWLKVDTGMHRLGLNQDEFVTAWNALRQLRGVGKVVVMSHLACADDLESDLTERQLASLRQTMTLAQIDQTTVEASLAASSGILLWPQTHLQWLRPGIMLYGGSAVNGENGEKRGLRPVMTLRSRLMAVRTVAAGETIGYGATHVCAHEQHIGVVSIGYGDGYPRHAPTGTPVLINSTRDSAGKTVPVRTQTLGRVSMDMLVVDLNACPTAAIGDEVILWGEGLPADEIARLCGTISYELFCQITSRVHYVYI